MRLLWGRSSLPGGPPRAVTVGTFDGVHRGHRALIGATVGRARDLGVESAAVTWDRHPLATLRPESAPPLLTSLERRLELLAGTGLDAVAVLEFDRDLSSWPPERFAVDVLARGLGAAAVVAGPGWRFGKGATGDVALLGAIGSEEGFEVVEIDADVTGDEPVSSSRIRALVAAGDVDTAAALLGRPFDVDGVVVPGDDRGRALGYPTANLVTSSLLARPPRGVYAGRARAAGRWHAAAINVGVNPTFGGRPDTDPVRIEAYLLDFEGDLYGSAVRIEFWSRLRDEIRFGSVEDLVAHIGRDVEATRGLVGEAGNVQVAGPERVRPRPEPGPADC